MPKFIAGALQCDKWFRSLVVENVFGRERKNIKRNKDESL